ncbi:MAG: 16S rRNA (cytidine(1402)-2'-O)-methyltransferase, partial [Pseudomonadota bacterium]
LHGVPLAGRPITAYHDHNAAQARGPLLAALAAGQSVLYASDAGTPLVADPGWRLAQAAREIGAAVHALPGPSAVLTALVLSGLPTDRFAFGGFLPPKAGARRRALESWRAVPGTLIFFESARRAAATLADVRDVLGAEREAALARELTKAFEQVRRGTAAELAEGAAADPPRGEVVLLIGPAPAEGAPDPAALDAALREALAAGTLKDAVRTVVERLSAPRKMVYARALELAEERKDPE